LRGRKKRRKGRKLRATTHMGDNNAIVGSVGTAESRVDDLGHVEDDSVRDRAGTAEEEKTVRVGRSRTRRGYEDVHVRNLHPVNVGDTARIR
jgi:hypothetical protein